MRRRTVDRASVPRDPAEEPDSRSSVSMVPLLRLVFRAAAGAVVLICSGCATLTGSTTQTIEITALDARDRAVNGMKCTLVNGSGEYTAETPIADLEIRRSSTDLEIECRRGSLVARGTVTSRSESAVAHSFIPGGSLATLIDHATGAMYTYPSPLRLRIGRHLRFEVSAEAKASVVATVGETTVAAAPPPPAPSPPPKATPAATAVSATRARPAARTAPVPTTPAATAPAQTRQASTRRGARSPESTNATAATQ
jgi:hypothetical protein